MILETSLTLNELRLMVRLGCTAEERTVLQPVDVTLNLQFAEIPRGATTDEIKDTVCYAKLSQLIEDTVRGREFKLIEHLSLKILEAIQVLIPQTVSVILAVKKLHPPVPHLQGGVSFNMTLAPKDRIK